MFCKFKDASNGTARTCVPRMRKRTPCSALICTGSGVDCGCKQDTQCTHYNTKTKRNETHWYCQDTKATQLALDGTLY